MQQHRQDGRLIYVIGATRQGKTQYVLSKTAKDKRLVVWDAKGEFAAKYGLESVSTIPELRERLIGNAGPLRISFRPQSPKRDFPLFCHTAHGWAMEAPCTIILEEIGNVTSPAKAADHYGTLLRMGLSLGPDIYCLNQRPQEADKTVIGNASEITVFRLPLETDKEYAAKRTGIPLKCMPLEQLQFIQKDADHNIRAGKISFDANSNPVINITATID